MKRTRLFGIACLALCNVFFLCTSPSNVAQNGGSEVVGTLVTKSGEEVIGAQVRAYKSIEGPDSFLFVHAVETGLNGRYSFDNLDSGLYYFECNARVGQDSLFALINNVNNDSIASPDQPRHVVDIGIDTMFPPGSISGKVHFDYGANMSGVSCYIPGTSFNALTDDTGAFKISNVPAGTYRVSFRYKGSNFSLNDTQFQNVVVQPTINTSIGTISMQLSGEGLPLKPLGLIFRYDTLTGQITVKWNRVLVPDFLKYEVFRQKSNNTEGFLSMGSVSDSFFIDKITFMDTMSYTVYYKVQCFDNSGHSSDFSDSVSLIVNPPAGTTMVNLSKPSSAGLFDNVTIIAGYTNKSAPVDTILWTTGNTNVIHTANKKSGWDTLKIQCKQLGEQTIYIKTIDALGRKSIDSAFITVVQDMPVINYLSPDQTIDAGGTVQCSLSVSHRFGSCTLSVHLGQTFADIKISYKTTSIVFDTAFSTGSALKWDSVSIKVTDNHGNVLKRGFAVTINQDTMHDKWVLSPAQMTGHHSHHAMVAVNRDLYVIGGTKLQLGAGGNGHIVQTAVVEAYDAAAKTWTAIDSLLNARYDFSANEANGNIYIVGGIGKKGYLTEIEQFDTKTKRWTVFDTTHIGQTRFLRAGTASCVVGNKLYLFGGRTPSANSGSDTVCQNILIYDISNKLWTEETSSHLNSARYEFQAVPLDGKIYLLGGLGVDDEPLKSIEIFDTLSGTCTMAAYTLSEELNNFSAVAYDSHIFVLGGINSSTFSVLNSVEALDPNTGVFETKAPLPSSAPAFNTAAVVFNNTIYVSGGLNDFNPTMTETTDKALYIYYP